MSAGDAHSGGGTTAHDPALQDQKTSQDLSVASGEPSQQAVSCVKVSYGRCAPIGITELLVRRARQEPPGVRLAMLHIWRAVLASLRANPQPYEPQWTEADLNPDASIMPEDRARAEAAADEALAPCKICVVDLQTFLKLVVRRAVLAAKPNGDLWLAVEIEHNGNYAFIATKTKDWLRKTKEGIKITIPLALQENLRRLGIDVDADPRDLYVELTRRAEYYNTVPDAYLRPILMRIVERLQSSPHLARCSRDNHVIYVAAELFRESAWYFNAYVGLGRNALYGALRRHGLLASPTTVPVILLDELGTKVKKRALAFDVNRLSEFVESDISEICRMSAVLAAAAAEDAEEPQTPLGGGHD